MANGKPSFIDVRSQSHGPLGTGSGLPSPRSLPSPRLHIAGDVPPALSPLDAFAAQSRMLAKQLEESSRSGRRISRLPPLTIANSLGPDNRPGFFRSVSAAPAVGDPDTPESPEAQSPGAALKTAIENPQYRPVSVYPQVGDVPSVPTAPLPPFNRNDEETFRGRRPPSTVNDSFFGGRREQSPADIGREQRFSRSGNSLSNVYSRPSTDSLRQNGQPPRRPQDGNLAVNGYDSRALAPPRSPFSQRNASPRSAHESSEDDLNSTNDYHGLSPPHRKQSSSSAFSASPTSAVFRGHGMPRSPSVSSEVSVGGTGLPKPAFNFSRPLSRASLASMSGLPVDTPSRQASSDSQPSFILADDTANTPISMHSEGFPDNDNGPAPSYVYSKFSLPRGKMLQRNSLIFQETMQQFQAGPFSNAPVHGAAPPSPPSRPSTSHKSDGQSGLDPSRSSHDQSRPSTESGFRKSRFSEESMSPSAASSSTIKARSQHSIAPSMEMDAEQHVEKAIEFHEAGSLTKSTYHLRLAARQNHPTGMLLYALACRHGWGCRPNQKEGVAWLRKAVDSAGLEVAEDEEVEKGGKTVDFLEKKTRKAQFALSIYELGVSHMNGWGIEQDKVLALRCFEIAGTWGDADALAETGFCYAQGIGCKKDLKKSAKFYRQAAEKGISMVGNSWIYKAKYNDDTDDDTTPKKSLDKDQLSTCESEKKQRSKSRSRGIFSRKKSTT
ncbi:hypothetical protein B0O99DRAFT_499254 [Bisporella sp. PMI_857]|nr:hypothetical protein B0O99DRAFT_499254 [Bisporella sp. PMI_857]